MMATMPVMVFITPGVTEDETAGCISGVNKLYKELFGVSAPVFFHGFWYGENSHDENGELVPYQSIEWFVQNSWDESRRQHRLEPIIYRLECEPLKRHEPHIDILLMESDLYMEGCNWVLGAAVQDSTVFSVARFRMAARGDIGSLIELETLHELGHLMRLPGNSRFQIPGGNVEDNLGSHCTNPGCVMRQGLTAETWLQHDWERRANGWNFCPQCIEQAVLL